MKRLDKKSTKIAYKILGKPANMRKRTKKDQEINRRLEYQETFRVR